MSEVSASIRKVSWQEDPTPEEKARETILTARKELDAAIEQLDLKIKRRMEVNECKFLLAYKNHLDKITRQLKILKQTYDVHEKKFSSDKAIVALGKQCTLFRQEAMRLHSQLEDAYAQSDIYKRKSEILSAEIQNANKMLKKSIYSNKLLEAQRLRLVLELSEKDKQITQLASKLNAHVKTKEHVESINIPQGNHHVCRKVPPSDIKVTEWQNQSPRALTNHEPDCNQGNCNYKVFEKEGFNLYSKTSKNQSVKVTRRGRNLTCSTLDCQPSLHQLTLLHEEDTCRNRKNIQKNERRDPRQSSSSEELFNKFVLLIKNARASSSSLKTPYNLKSKNLNELMESDDDILEICWRLFPSLPIRNDFTLDLSVTSKHKSVRAKTLTQLSTHLMKKFTVERPDKIQKTGSQNQLHLSSQELQYISKKKEQTNTSPQNKDNKIQRLATERAQKLKKMNDSFKRKTLPNRSVLSSFCLSARAQCKRP